MPDLHLLGHRSRIPLDHVDRSITKEKLYSKLFNNIWAFYYYATGASVYHHENPFLDHTVHATKETITDIGFINIGRDGSRTHIRLTSPTTTTFYEIGIYIGSATQDFRSVRCVTGTCTTLGYEAVDLSDYHYLYGGSIAGSTIKGFRAWVDMSNYKSATAKFTVTDTQITSGLFSLGHVRGYHQHYYPFAYITYPWSEGAKAQVAVEVEIESGRPRFLEARAEPTLQVVPETIKNDYKQYKKLREKGLTDEEIEFLLGRKPKTSVNLLAVTNGAIDCRDSSYCLYAIFDSNPYNPHAPLGQLEHARRRSLTVYKPRDYSYLDFYRREKEKRGWLITENELAYQLFGREDLELKAVADFYWREVVELNRLKEISEPIRDVLNYWLRRSRELKVEYAERKLTEVIKKI
jgi:hypothetical protein